MPFPMQDLFTEDLPDRRIELLAPGAWVLHGFALERTPVPMLLAAINR